MKYNKQPQDIKYERGLKKNPKYILLEVTRKDVADG
jgi:hypothetical protein